jgi:hypothetical protein
MFFLTNLWGMSRGMMRIQRAAGDIAVCDVEDAEEDVILESENDGSVPCESRDQPGFNDFNCDEDIWEESSNDIQRRLDMLVAASVEDGQDSQAGAGGSSNAHVRMFTADKKVFFVSQAESKTTADNGSNHSPPWSSR